MALLADWRLESVLLHDADRRAHRVLLPLPTRVQVSIGYSTHSEVRTSSGDAF